MFSCPVSIELGRVRNVVATKVESHLLRRGAKAMKQRVKMVRALTVVSRWVPALGPLASVMAADLPRQEVLLVDAAEAVGNAVRSVSLRPLKEFGEQHDPGELQYNVAFAEELIKLAEHAR